MTSLETSDEDYRDPDFYLRTADAAFEAVCSLQLYIGHVAVKTRSHSRGKYGFDTHIDVQCQDSGKYRAHKNKKGAYKTSTRKTGCPFLAKIRRDGALERFEYKIVIENHNHEAVSEVLGSSIIRRTTQEKFGLDKLKALVADRSKNSANTARESSRQITADQPEVKIIAEDIHYIRRQLRAERYGPYTSTQAFIRMLQQDPHIFYWNIDRAANNTLCRFFWIYHAHLDQWRKNSQVLVMDNAYKVNRFNLPLLEVTSVTALNTNFSCGFGFAAKENAEFFQLLLTSMKTAMERANVAMPSVILSDFDHALKKALCSIFETTQQQLCVWHILKNVSVWHILKNVSFNVKKKWLGSLEGYIIMGHAKSDAARNIADIDTNPTTSPDFAFEDIWAENIIDEAEESASLMASHIVHKFTADLNSQISGPAASRKFEDTADGIIEAWDCVTYAPTEDEFRDNWDMLCREFSHQKRELFVSLSSHLECFIDHSSHNRLSSRLLSSREGSNCFVRRPVSSQFWYNVNLSERKRSF